MIEPTLLGAAFEHHPDALALGVAVRDPLSTIIDIRLTHMNAVARSSHSVPEAAIGLTWTALWPSMVDDGSLDACIRTLTTGECESGEFLTRSRQTNGPTASAYRAVRIADDVLLWSVTDRSDSVRRIAEESTRFEAAFSHAPAGMSLIDETGTIVLANESLATLTCRTVDALVGRAFDSLFVRADREPIHQAMREISGGEATRSLLEVQLPTGSGDRSWVSMSLTPLVDPDGGQLQCIAHLHDITSRKHLESALHHRATHDALTGLANRTLFDDLLRDDVALLGAGNALAILFIDVDEFKVINDALGHAVGDAVLVAVADRLTATTRASDVVARLGGDEFALLCRNLPGEASGLAIAEQIRRSFVAPIVADGHTLNVRVSIGMATTTSPDATSAKLIRDADVAMYRAKAQGRDRTVSATPTLSHRAASRLTIENELRRALIAGEFFLEYQPIVDLRSGAMRGMEALVRWRHPQQGVIPPDRFIPAAEQMGLIVALGEWVLCEATMQLARWQARHEVSELSVAVNLSARQLADADIVATVRAALDRSGIDPTTLTLEVTESMLMADTELAELVLNQVELLGVRVSLDDFGTGYSSLSHLRRFTVDALKVDRSFVAGLTESSEDGVICAAIIALANALGLHVVAEGVETPDQLERLVTLGCVSAQGYLLARPVDVAGIDEILSSRQVWQIPSGLAVGRGRVASASVGSTPLNLRSRVRARDRR